MPQSYTWFSKPFRCYFCAEKVMKARVEGTNDYLIITSSGLLHTCTDPVSRYGCVKDGREMRVVEAVR